MFSSGYTEQSVSTTVQATKGNRKLKVFVLYVGIIYFVERFTKKNRKRSTTVCDSDVMLYASHIHVHCFFKTKTKKSGCAKRGCTKKVSPYVMPEEAAPVTRATLRTAGTVPADSWR